MTESRKRKINKVCTYLTNFLTSRRKKILVNKNLPAVIPFDSRLTKLNYNHKTIQLLQWFINYNKFIRKHEWN